MVVDNDSGTSGPAPSVYLPVLIESNHTPVVPTGPANGDMVPRAQNVLFEPFSLFEHVFQHRSEGRGWVVGVADILQTEWGPEALRRETGRYAML